MATSRGPLIPRRTRSRRRTVGRRVRKELRSLKRWTTVFVVLWGYFKLSGSPPDRADAPGSGPRPPR